MPTKSNKMRRMPVFLARGKYYTRIRWGNDKTFRGDVKFPLGDDKLKAEHRRDIIQDSSLRGKIISAYEKESLDGVGKIKDQIDWFSRSTTLVDSEIKLNQVINEYNDYCIGQRLNKSTIEIYLRTLDEFAEITKVKRIDRIKKMHFTMFKKRMVHLSKPTVNRKLRSLQTFFNWMYDEGTIESPIKIKKLPVISPAVNYFSNAEFNIILQNVKKGFPYGEARMQDNDQNLFISALGDFLSAMESGGMSRDKEYKIFNNLYKEVTKAQKELSRLMPKLKKLTNDGKVYKALHDLKGKVK